MPRVTCVECAGEVVVDPSGRCPEGHLVGTEGARVEHAIGTGAPHPEEPEPWVATIAADEIDGGDASPDNAPPPARPAPVRAPGFATTAEAEAPADTDDLFHELQSLAEPSDQRPARSGNGATPAPAPATPPAAAEASAAAVPDGSDEHPAPTDPGDTPRPGGPAGPSASDDLNAASTPAGSDDDHRASDVAALEAMLQGFDDEPLAEVTELDAFRDAASAGHADGSPSRPATTTPEPPTRPGTSAPEQPPTDAPSAQPSPPPPPTSAPEQPSSAPAPAPDERPAEEPPQAAAGSAGLDLTNFTAKGTKVGGKGRGRHKRLGR